jgi:hypothetical protein
MKTHGQIQVTLSDELFEALRAQARELNVPMKWLVAGLVCDTIDPVDSPNCQEPRRQTRHVA